MRYKQVLSKMVTENIELMHEYSPQHYDGSSVNEKERKKGKYKIK